MIRWIMLAASLVLLTLFFPHSSDVEQSREPGSIWSGDTIRADFSFPLLKEEIIYDREVQTARSNALPVFRPTNTSFAAIRDSLRDIVSRLDSSDLAGETGDATIFGEGSRRWLRTLEPGARQRQLDRIVTQLIAGITDPYERGIIDRSRSRVEAEKILVRRSTAVEEELAIAALYDSLMVMQRLDAQLAGAGIEKRGYAVAIDLLAAVWEPTYRLSPDLTRENREAAANAVPRTGGLVRKGDIIVRPGEQITEATALKLTSFERSRSLRRDESSRWLRMIGSLGHVIILLALPLIYLFNFRRRIYADNLQLGIILGTLILVSALARLSIELVTTLPIEYLILIPFLSTLLAILYDSRTAFYLTVVASLFVAGVRGSDYTVAIALLSAGVLAAYTVRDIKSRTQLYRSIAYAVAGFSVAIISLGLERGAPFGEIGLELGFAAVNAVLSPVLTFGAIFLLESIFNVATDLKLLEYDDLNHPLLRQLADKAPGTYQHTLTIARLAESAAAAIGANALQAKVGASFHDIGKAVRSEYFVENQMGMGNKHDLISPEQSVKIIRDHVADGVKIARQYRLPERIIDFIPTHHGTTTIKYFLDKAKEKDPDVDEALFRYPGPLPHTRETAIVMLADAVEATTRSLPDPTAANIKETVDLIIKRRFSDGQLDECDLTLADMTKIREAFVRNLVGMAHPRIQYKKDDDDPPETGSVELPAAKKKDEEVPFVDDAFGGLKVDAKDLKKKTGEAVQPIKKPGDAKE